MALNMLINESKQMLTQKIIPFWQGLRDDDCGGFTGWMGFDLKKDRNAVKGCILQSRILWFFSTAASVLCRNDLLKDAKHAYRFLTEHCLDRENGGVFWSVNSDGSVRDGSKHTYCQAFALYALSAYSRASGDREALDAALSLYHTIEEHCSDSISYMEAFDRQFRPVPNKKLSGGKAFADKTMNTLLHLLEAYGELYEVSRDKSVAESLRRIILIFLNSVYNPKKHRQDIFQEPRSLDVVAPGPLLRPAGRQRPEGKGFFRGSGSRGGSLPRGLP